MENTYIEDGLRLIRIEDSLYEVIGVIGLEKTASVMDYTILIPIDEAERIFGDVYAGWVEIGGFRSLWQAVGTGGEADAGFFAKRNVGYDLRGQ